MITISAHRSRGRHLARILRGTAITALCAFGLAWADHAKASDFPDQPITVYAPSAAGSASDVEARVLARSMARILKQPVTVIDMPGGSGSVAEAQLQSRRADGYTLLFEPSSLLTYTVGEKMVPYAITDFVGVAGVGGDAVCLAVRTDDARFASLPNFIAYAHSHPNTVTVGGFGTAGAFADTYRDLAARAKIDARYIPYNGGGELMVALLGQHLDAVVTAPSNVISNSKLHIIAISSQTTFPPLPSTPTFTSFGYDVVHPVQRGFFAKKGIPAPVMQTLEKAIKAATEDPDWQRVAKHDVIQTQFFDSQNWQAYVTDSFRKQAQAAAPAGK